MNETKFNIKSVLSTLLGDLQERSRDVVVSRFGIGRDDYETLEAIGQRYGITRERVRQIEADAIKHIKNQKEEVLSPLLVALTVFMRSQGDAMEEEALRAQFASRHFSGVENTHQYKGMVSLLLSVGEDFNRIALNDNFFARWFTSAEALKTQEKVAGHVVSQLKSLGGVVEKDKLVSVASSAISSALNKEAVLNFLAASRLIEQNVFGKWGLTHWAEIKPRGVKDKAYLVMKQSGKPLHFRDVAGHINDNEFSTRAALAQTVHNELIKDSRFVLVGRGLYALKEWGYKKGTVKDVIKRVLVSRGPMAKGDLVKAVLKERFVKPSTIILNLNSFKKGSDNKYTLV